MKKTYPLLLALAVLFVSCTQSAGNKEEFSFSKLTFEVPETAFTAIDGTEHSLLPPVIYKEYSIDNNHYVIGTSGSFEIYPYYDGKQLDTFEVLRTDFYGTAKNEFDIAYFAGKIDYTDPDTFTDFCTTYQLNEKDIIYYIFIPYIEIPYVYASFEGLKYNETPDDDCFISIYNETAGDYVNYYAEALDYYKGDYVHIYNSSHKDTEPDYWMKDPTDFSEGIFSLYLDDEFEDPFFFDTNGEFYFLSYNQYILNMINSLTGYNFTSMDNIIYDIDWAFDEVYGYNHYGMSYREYDLSNGDYKVFNNYSFAALGSIPKFQASFIDDHYSAYNYDTDTTTEFFYQVPVLIVNLNNIAVFDKTDPKQRMHYIGSEGLIDHHGIDLSEQEVYIDFQYMKFSPFENKVIYIPDFYGYVCGHSYYD